MKKLVILLAVVFTANVMLAQKMDRTNAYNYNRNGQYEKAIDAIEKCVNHEGFLGMKPKDQAQAWLYRGTIYVNAHQKPELAEKYPDALDKAYESLENCIKVDPSYAKDNASEIYPRIAHIAATFFQNGVDNFNSEAYPQAGAFFRKSFDISTNGTSPDTSALVNAALSFMRANMYDEALANYEDLKNLGYNHVDLYKNMSNCYLAKDDEEKSLEMIQAGLDKYPGDAGLIIEKINLFIKQGKSEEAVADLTKLHEMDPNNASILFILGTIYGNDSHDIFDADKAIGYYTEAINTDSTYYDASYNLAALYLNLASKKQTEADGLGFSPAEQKKYTALMKEREDFLRAGLPFAEKAYKAQPSEDMKRALRSIYVNLNMLKEVKELDAE